MTLKQSKKIQIIVFIIALIVLTTVWAINGYDDTWLYVTAAIIAIPVSWYSFSQKNS